MASPVSVDSKLSAHVRRLSFPADNIELALEISAEEGSFIERGSQTAATAAASSVWQQIIVYNEYLTVC